MASKVEICNMALARLGGATIISLEDGTQESKLCSTFFDQVADRVMMQGSWTSTIKRAELAQTTITPEFRYQFAYQLPTDPKSLKVLDVDESESGNIEYVIEGDKLLTNNETIKIKYIAQLTNTEDWDSMLTEAFEISLASYLALPLTAQETIAEKLKQEYLFFIDNNLAIDGQQGSNFEYFTTEGLEVRT